MKTISTSLLLICILQLHAQNSPLYIQLVTHNEPNDFLQNQINYAKAKTALLQMANLVNSRNAKWNLQTSDGLVIGALADQNASGTNIFSTLASPPFSDNVQIDPRSKNMGGRNIADQWYLLDSLGANPTTHLGGCIYSSDDTLAQPIDWEDYRLPKTGNVYGNSWQCTLLTGAGSYPPHSNDLNDFGVFKPNNKYDFYTHNPSGNLWCMGTGCAPVLDSLEDEQEIIRLIKAQADSIQNGLWPPNHFYVTRIMTNHREFGPMFFQKLNTVLDSLAEVPDTRLKWATIGETFAAFQAWQTTTGRDHSQWLCGEVYTGIPDETITHTGAFPNPADNRITIKFSDEKMHLIRITDLNGIVMKSETGSGNLSLNVSDLSAGVYVMQQDSGKVSKMVIAR